MLAAVDMGNTTVVLKYIEEDGSLSQKTMWKTKDFKPKRFVKKVKDCEAVLISSVVDDFLPDIQGGLEELDVKYLVVDQHVKSPVDFSSYESSMGPDRVSAVIGAAASYRAPFAVVDMGTAITFSYVDENYKYQGGLILPGAGTMLKSLGSFTHRLPELKLAKKPQSLLGLTTDNNILNGTYYIIEQGILGILQQLKRQNFALLTVCTGGWSSLFKHCFDYQDKDLIFKGLSKIYEENGDL